MKTTTWILSIVIVTQGICSIIAPAANAAVSWESSTKKPLQQLAKTDDSAQSHIDQGNTKYTAGDKKGALIEYNRAIEIDPNSPVAYTGRGNVKDDLGDKEGAIADYNHAIEINPNYPDAYYNRGITQANSGNRAEAIDDLTKAAELFRQQDRTDSYEAAKALIEKLQKS
jgi:tetratricopeptide (TPR) repeat protein